MRQTGLFFLFALIEYSSANYTGSFFVADTNDSLPEYAEGIHFYSSDSKYLVTNLTIPVMRFLAINCNPPVDKKYPLLISIPRNLDVENCTDSYKLKVKIGDCMFYFEMFCDMHYFFEGHLEYTRRIQSEDHVHIVVNLQSMDCYEHGFRNLLNRPFDIELQMTDYQSGFLFQVPFLYIGYDEDTEYFELILVLIITLLMLLIPVVVIVALKIRKRSKRAKRESKSSEPTPDSPEENIKPAENKIESKEETKPGKEVDERITETTEHSTVNTAKTTGT